MAGDTVCSVSPAGNCCHFILQLTCLTLGCPNGPAYSTGELLNTPQVFSKDQNRPRRFSCHYSAFWWLKGQSSTSITQKCHNRFLAIICCISSNLLLVENVPVPVVRMLAVPHAAADYRARYCV